MAGTSSQPLSPEDLLRTFNGRIYAALRSPQTLAEFAYSQRLVGDDTIDDLVSVTASQAKSKLLAAIRATVKTSDRKEVAVTKFIECLEHTREPALNDLASEMRASLSLGTSSSEHSENELTEQDQATAAQTDPSPHHSSWFLDSIPDGELDPGHLRDVFRYVNGRYKWKRLGLYLHISYARLIMIEEDNHREDDCMKEMLRQWYISGTATKQTLVGALTASLSGTSSSVHSENVLTAQDQATAAQADPAPHHSSWFLDRIPDGELDPDHLCDVLHCLGDLYEWKKLGRYLNISYSTLQKIEIDNQEMDHRKLEMLYIWLCSGTANKQTLVHAMTASLSGTASNVHSEYELTAQDQATATQIDTSPHHSSWVLDSIPDGELCSSDLLTLHECLLDVYEWKLLGIHLNISCQTLDMIKKENRRVDGCMIAMLHHWLESGTANKQTLVLALTVLSSKRANQKKLTALMNKYKDQPIINYKSLKCTFIGPPRVGKTTARKRLMEEMINISSSNYTESASTDLQEPYIVQMCDDESDLAPCVLGSQQWKEVDSWLGEMQLLLPNVQTQNEPVSLPRQIGIESRAQRKVRVQKDTRKPKDVRPQLLTFNYVEKMVEEFLEKRRLEDIKDMKETVTAYVMDFGGQPEFQDVLPIVLRGPALHLVFFDASVGLNDPVNIKFCPRKGSANSCIEYDTNYTVREMLFQILSSLYCLSETQGNVTLPPGQDLPQFKPTAILIGTHTDRTTSEHLDEVNATLKKLFQGTEFWEKFLRVPDSCKTVFYPLDNNHGTKEEIHHLQKCIKDLIKWRLKSTEMPRSWLVFHIALRHRYEEDGWCTMEQCVDLAAQCNILEEDVLPILHYIHHHVGNVLHYADVPDLCGLVFCEPNKLLKAINHVIILSFVGDPHYPDRTEKIRETGEIPWDLLKEVKCEAARIPSITNEQVISLLKHFKLIIEIPKEPRRIFIPCLLRPNPSIKPASQDELKNVKLPPPLLIWFDGNYIPFSAFPGLAVELMSKHDWILKRKCRSRNHLTFDCSSGTVELREHCQFFEGRLTEPPSDSQSLHECCRLVKETIEVATKNVLHAYEHTKQTRSHFGFYCPCSSTTGLEPHFCKLIPNSRMICIKEEVRFSLGNEAIWLRELECKPTVSDISSGVLHLQQQPPPSVNTTMPFPMQATVLNSSVAQPYHSQASYNPQLAQMWMNPDQRFAQTQSRSSPSFVTIPPRSGTPIGHTQASSSPHMSMAQGSSFLYPPHYWDHTSPGMLLTQAPLACTEQHAKWPSSAGFFTSQSSYEMADESEKKKRNAGQRILDKHISTVTSVVKANPDNFFKLLLENSLVSRDAYDPEHIALSNEQKATKLYSQCGTAVGIASSNFSKVVEILSRYPPLYPVVDEMKREGEKAGLMTSAAANQEASPVPVPQTVSIPPTQFLTMHKYVDPRTTHIGQELQQQPPPSVITTMPFPLPAAVPDSSVAVPFHTQTSYAPQLAQMWTNPNQRFAQTQTRSSPQFAPIQARSGPPITHVQDPTSAGFIPSQFQTSYVADPNRQ